ncbi:MAG: hypothetical protein GSR85_00075 [Desulfurococcales archaeon]|nr:hypothetical protein [Desulfurococcales archaeon]
MAGGRIYAKYKSIIEELGLRQLDVYRVIKDGRITDVLRIQDPMSGKILIFDLEAPREALSLLEFFNKLKEALEEAKIEVSERRLNLIEERLKRIEVEEGKIEEKEEKPEATPEEEPGGEGGEPKASEA